MKCIRMNSFAAEVTRLLCPLISTQIQQNLPRYVEVLKLQKEFEETCMSPGIYYICGGANKKEKEKIIKKWQDSFLDIDWIKDQRVEQYHLGLVGTSNV